jgi:ubiquinone biosynthesis monooxygenase Coq6
MRQLLPRLVHQGPQLKGRRLSSSIPDGKFFDVAIVGGGVVGSSLANLLAMKLPNLKVCLIDSKENSPSQLISGRVPSPRSYALSPRSLQVLGESVRSRLPIGYYDSMQVWQDSSPASLTFTSSDIDADPSKGQYLGGCCEDQALVAALYEDIQGSTEILLNTKLDSFDVGDSNNLVTIKTTEGSEFKTALLVGADGGNSWVRKAAGISRIGGGYEQHALTFTVSIEKTSTMNGRAFQRYLSDGGALALLPTFSPNHAVIVCSSSPENISQWKSASNDDLVRHLNDSLLEGPQRISPLMGKTGPLFASNQSRLFSNLVYGADRVLDTVHYGLAMASQHPKPSFRVPPKIGAIASPKFTFPLSCYNATTYVKDRMALVGDAAHTFHPMAGKST